jgi:hypothetical protein
MHKDTDITVIKGVMGLYDSVDGIAELGSTADAKSADDTCVAPRQAENLSSRYPTKALRYWWLCRSLRPRLMPFHTATWILYPWGDSSVSTRR